MFTRVFPRLIVGRSALPKKRSDLQVLLTSIVLVFEFDRTYSEQEVNAMILAWTARFGAELSVDHVTLRRYLVDEGILHRDGSGSRYQASDASPHVSYDRSIRDLDLEELVERDREARAQRKRRHMGTAPPGE